MMASDHPSARRGAGRRAHVLLGPELQQVSAQHQVAAEIERSPGILRDQTPDLDSRSAPACPLRSVSASSSSEAGRTTWYGVPLSSATTVRSDSWRSTTVVRARRKRVDVETAGQPLRGLGVIFGAPFSEPVDEPEPLLRV